MAGRSHTVLCGSDGLAIRVLAELVALDEEIVVVTGDEHCALAEAAREACVAVVIGDFRRDVTLRRASIGEAAALALLEQDDVANIGVALAAQESNPAVHLVVRMFNIELGRTLEGLFEDCRILSAAALAAPAFADAAIHGQTGQSVRVLGRELEVRELAASDPRVVVTLMTRTESAEEMLFPTKGERVLALVRRKHDDPGRRRARQMASLRERFVARLGGVAMLFDRRLALLLAALLVIVAVSSAVFEHYYDLRWIDAVSGTITTVAGGGDIDLAKASGALKLYGAAITVVGALTVAILFALVTDAIVGVRLARALGDPPLPSRDHMVVCGLGRIGFRVVERLVQRRIPCIAVEQAEDSRFIASARALGVPVIVADASLPRRSPGCA